jgi:hypothetical protein
MSFNINFACASFIVLSSVSTLYSQSLQSNIFKPQIPSGTLVEFDTEVGLTFTPACNTFLNRSASDAEASEAARFIGKMIVSGNKYFISGEFAKLPHSYKFEMGYDGTQFYTYYPDEGTVYVSKKNAFADGHGYPRALKMESCVGPYAPYLFLLKNHDNLDATFWPTNRDVEDPAAWDLPKTAKVTSSGKSDLEIDFQKVGYDGNPYTLKVKFSNGYPLSFEKSGTISGVPYPMARDYKVTQLGQLQIGVLSLPYPAKAESEYWQNGVLFTTWHQTTTAKILDKSIDPDSIFTFDYSKARLIYDADNDKIIAVPL